MVKYGYPCREMYELGFLWFALIVIQYSTPLKQPLLTRLHKLNSLQYKVNIIQFSSSNISLNSTLLSKEVFH